MIHKLQITHVRNLTSADIVLADCNVFVGKNGSGKTSLLEAVFLLSRGKSFRHHEPKRYIQHHQRACTVWADTASGQLAIQKVLDDKGCATSIMRHQGQSVYSQSVLSFVLPTLFIDPSGMTILEEGSAERRQLLDWLVFHVEHGFYESWLAYQKALKQRNALLKSPYIRQRMMEISAWNQELDYHANILNECRQRVFDEWQSCFEMMLTQILPKYAQNISLTYQAGFDDKVGLFEILQQRFESDIQLGYTRVGSHRADIAVNFCDKNSKESATNVLSRGEKKLLIMALKLSQLQMVCDKGGKPVVLIDDIDAELDDRAMNKLLEVVLRLPCQLMISSLQESTLQAIADKVDGFTTLKSFKKFHVKQGEITEVLDYN